MEKRTKTIDSINLAPGKLSYSDLEGALVKALKDNNIIDTESLFGLYAAAGAHPEINDLFDIGAKYSLDVEEGLTNGDKVTLTFVYNNDAYKNIGVRLKGKSITYTVEGLDEVEVFDPFDGLEISYRGYSSYGKASISKVPSSYLA